ncbi:MAG: oxidoreductase, partial [Planctomycetales bacterium]|nr:oxidoreductase [Planctomycetales bacterium]
GCIAACGLVGGAELQMSVYPFLLRGVTLAGVASADCPYPRRIEIWNKLAGEWRLSELDSQVTEVPLDDVDREVRRILNGEQVGRVIVRIGA